MAENKGFDLSALIDSVPDLDTGRQQIVYLPIEQIERDPDNFYSMDGVDELAGSIEMLGLQQPLLVRPSEDGKYIVISGHRRRAAILLIRDGGSQQFAEGVPCIIDTGTASEALRKLKLILANSDTRKMTSADENRQAEQIEEILRELSEQGIEFKGRFRDWVAKFSGMSRSKLGRLKVIRDKLAPELRATYYDTGIWNEDVAYTLAQQSVDVQRAMIKDYIDCKRPVTELQAGHVRAYLSDMQRRAHEQQQRKEQAEGIKEKLQREADSYIADYAADTAKFFKELCEPNLFRFLIRKISPSMDRSDGIFDLKSRVGKTRFGGSMENGWYNGDPRGLDLAIGKQRYHVQRTWTEVYDMLAQRAIYLINTQKAESEQPKAPTATLDVAEPTWQHGKPPKAGVYAVRFKVSETAAGELHSFARWDCFHWKAVRSGKIIDDMIAVGWYPIPEV